MVKKGNVNVVLGDNYSGKATYLKEVYKKEKKAILYIDKIDSIERMNIDLKILNQVFLELGIEKRKKLSDVPFSLKRLYTLGMVLASDYDTILLNEPFLRFDNKVMRRICRAIRYIRNNFNKTIYIASVDPSYLYQIADNVILMHKGAVVFEGDKHEFFDNKDMLEKQGYAIPEIIRFINLVEKEKNIRLGNIDNNNDLMKAIYQNTKY